MPSLATHFRTVGAPVSLKRATKGSKVNTEECDQKVWNLIDQVGITVPCSARNFLEVDARVSLKVTTKGLLRIKKLWKFTFSAGFSKAKTEAVDQKV